MPTFIQRFLKRVHPQEVTWADFENFIKQGIEEHQNLEYKPRGILVKKDGTPIASSNSREVVGYTALAKTVASFANAEGGLLVLGVREKVEKFRGSIVKIRPGALSPIPHTVTREAIENQLLARIQHPVEGLTILPLRRSLRTQASIYLIDVPASYRAPHRVNEHYYYQRYNFTTLEMKHYQIADLFGRRSSPDLTVSMTRAPNPRNAAGNFTVEVVMSNKGRAVAKFVTAICQVIEGSFSVFRCPNWHKTDGNTRCQFQTKADYVIYPDIPMSLGEVEFSPTLPRSTKKVLLRISVYAEGMSGRTFNFTVDTNVADPLGQPDIVREAT
jgi:hypothetical protein